MRGSKYWCIYNGDENELEGVGVLVGEGVNFVVLVMLLVEGLVEGGEGVQEAMGPVCDKVLDKVQQHHLSKQLQQGGEPIVFPVPVATG